MSKIKGTISGFTPVFDVVAQELGTIAAVVHGQVWRHCQMSRHVCDASRETMANECGLSIDTFKRHLPRLVEAGYIKDLTPHIRYKPHTYIDTGKIKISAKLSVSIESDIDTNDTESDILGSAESTTKVVQRAPLGSAESTINIPLRNHRVNHSSCKEDTEQCSQDEPLTDEWMNDAPLEQEKQEPKQEHDRPIIDLAETEEEKVMLEMLASVPGYTLIKEDLTLIRKYNHTIDTLRALIEQVTNSGWDNIGAGVRTELRKGWKPKAITPKQQGIPKITAYPQSIIDKNPELYTDKGYLKSVVADLKAQGITEVEVMKWIE